MIVDTSALMAVLQGEPEADTFSECLIEQAAVMSAGSLLELRIVVQARGVDRLNQLDELLKEFEIEIVVVDEQQARLGAEAYRKYGRGSQHPARLNYGDCFSYALAISRDEPLLFKGDDFVHTDVRVAH